VIGENFPNLEKEMPIQEALWTPNRKEQNRTSPQHIIVKTLRTENKKRILEATKEKPHVTYKSKPIRIMGRFLNRNLTLKARKSWNGGILSAERK
jgi:hypothetical protein